MSKNMNVPKLRFSEFGGEWEEKKLDTFSFRSAEKNKNSSVTLVFTNSAINGIVNQQDYFDKDIANQNNLEGYYVVNKDDFIYNPRISNFAPVGPLNRNHLDKKGIMSPLYTVFKIDEKKVNLDFIEKYFKTTKWHKYMNAVANYGARSDRMNITNIDFFAMPISLPSKQEQEKIASFLSSIDTKIEQLTKKESLLQEYKKGVMQKIFNQEIRFKADDGSEFCEWEEKKLGEVYSFLRGSTLSKSDISLNGINKCIHYGELFTSYNVKIFTVKSKTTLINGQFSKIGDILMPSSDVTPQGLATASALMEENVIIGGDINILRPKNNISSIFVSYFLNTNKNEIMKLVTGTTIKHIYNKDIATLKLNLPCLQEQTKIANFLSSIDKKIENSKKELEKTKEFKKALLQQMFV